MAYSDPEFVVRDGENGPENNDPYAHYYFVAPGPYQPEPGGAGTSRSPRVRFGAFSRSIHGIPLHPSATSDK